MNIFILEYPYQDLQRPTQFLKIMEFGLQTEKDRQGIERENPRTRTRIIDSKGARFGESKMANNVPDENFSGFFSSSGSAYGKKRGELNSHRNQNAQEEDQRGHILQQE